MYIESGVYSIEGLEIKCVILKVIFNEVSKL